jgi:hypothetical protein
MGSTPSQTGGGWATATPQVQNMLSIIIPVISHEMSSQSYPIVETINQRSASGDAVCIRDRVYGAYLGAPNGSKQC